MATGAAIKSVAIIPARMGSSRFPGKPLAPLMGRTMIEHVYRRTAACEALADVFVATCDEEIRAAVEAFGGKAIMTADTHERASDRVAEAARAMEADVVVMVQGDEPLIEPGMIDAALRPFTTEPGIECVNLAKRIETEDDYRNPDTIKVVIDHAGFALYMSRAPIPTIEKTTFADIRAYKQVCVIPFTRTGLIRFAALPPTPLEIAESIDMLRFLESGTRVRMIETQVACQSVDRPADLARVERIMRGLE